MDTGTKTYRNYFPIKFGWQCDCKYGKLYPVFRKLCYPGDVFKINADLLIRYQPMLAPPMNDATATVRFFLVPIRLVEQNTELIVTGSQQGKLYTNTLPVMDSVFKYLNLANHTTIQKHSLLDLLYGIPAGIDLSATGLLTKLDNDKASPAAYFAKAYYRCWFDYYRDENIDSANDFETEWNYVKPFLHEDDSISVYSVRLKKDRITSSTPWQLKAVAAPVIEINGSGTMTPNYNEIWGETNGDTGMGAVYADTVNPVGGFSPFSITTGSGTKKNFNDKFNALLNQPQSVTITSAGFTMAQIRELSAQTRIFERLARCGSRYTEYLKANFGIAPDDGTLQRAQYLGGFKTRIVTTEVVQTAADGANPVGTLRGHGITHGTSTIKPFLVKEPSVVLGLMDIVPETIYAQGVDRELTVRSRFDFFNPSFQHLSEQEVRKGEIYFGVDTDSDGNLVNSQTWGFQPYGEEYRRGIKHVCGNMRDNLSFWNQALIFSSRPNLNTAFLNTYYHTASYNRPFAVNGSNAIPLVVDFGGVIEAYRPLVKNGTPGLVDHN